MVERVVVGTLKTNCYIYSSAKKECLIIDPGDDPEGIAARVDVLNMVPVGIVLTHGHLDHVAAVGLLKASYAARGYPLAVAIHAADRKFLGAKAADAHRASLESLDLIDSAIFGDSFPPLPKADTVLGDGDRVLGMDLEVIETPGTPRAASASGRRRKASCSRATRSSSTAWAAPTSRGATRRSCARASSAG